jgi:3-mercaptopyruvate sulfurtransferase SseA
LSNGIISNKYRKFKTFKKAREFSSKLNLKGKEQWFAYCKAGNLPLDIPTNPQRTYKNKGWESWGDWLGTGRIAHCNRASKSFEEARNFAHSLNLKSGKEWRVYCKSGEKPDNIPAYPNEKYKNEGWTSMGDWLGKL